METVQKTLESTKQLVDDTLDAWSEIKHTEKGFYVVVEFDEEDV